MFKLRLILILPLFGLFVSCSEDTNSYNNENEPENEEEIITNQFSVDANFNLKNELPINIEGVVYTPGYWQCGKVLGLGSSVDTVFLEDFIFTYGPKKHII